MEKEKRMREHNFVSVEERDISEKVSNIVRGIIETFKLDISDDEIAGFDFKWDKETTRFSLKTFPVKPTPIKGSYKDSQFFGEVSCVETGYLDKNP